MPKLDRNEILLWILDHIVWFILLIVLFVFLHHH